MNNYGLISTYPLLSLSASQQAAGSPSSVLHRTTHPLLIQEPEDDDDIKHTTS